MGPLPGRGVERPFRGREVAGSGPQGAEADQEEEQAEARSQRGFPRILHSKFVSILANNNNRFDSNAFNVKNLIQLSNDSP